VDKDKEYRAHVAANLGANPRARVIEVSDFTDNGVGVIDTTGPKAVRLAWKYARSFRCWPNSSTADAPLEPNVQAHALRQLHIAQERFAAITPPMTTER
jgi:hypothetical protein